MSPSPDRPGVLYLVATPIGNLSDLSPRALDVLGNVSVVYAEDTRRTRKLVSHFDLDTRLVSLHAHNERERTAEVIEALGAGEDRALVSDAGTPTVSDPGAALVRAVADAGLSVVPIPGPSAVVTALAASGFSADRFTFLGFAPRRGADRAAWLRRCARAGMTVVAFESPRRVGRLLEDLAEAGLGDASACVCRELTKVHEEVRRGTVAALADYYGEAAVRGEVTVVIDAGTAETHPAEREEAARAVARRMSGAGATTREIAGTLKREHGLARNVAYEIALEAGTPDAGSGHEVDGERT